MMQDLRNDLIRDEGFVPHAYQDSEGYWTIGVGRLIDKRRGGGITREEAEYLLDNDIDRTTGDLHRNIPWWTTLPDPAKRALVNMCFNLGWPRLSGFRRMLAALKRGDYLIAADEALDSKWARQVGVRADRIADLYRSAAKMPGPKQ